jgi:hypothetical protein
MENKVNQNIIGLNLDSINWQVKENQITWALNANVQSHDGNSVTYTNEPGNTECFRFDEGSLAGFVVVGFTNIIEQSKVILFLSHPDGRSRIGQVTSISDSCLDVTITEKDCGCKEGTIITTTEVVESLPLNETVLECPDGYVYDSVANICKKIQYIPIKTSAQTVPVIATCVDGTGCGVFSTHGCLLPVVYDTTWPTLNPNTYSTVGTSLPQQFWVPGDTLPIDPIFNTNTYVKTISIQADLDPLAGACRECHVISTVTAGNPEGFLGFAETICINETKQYYLALGADEALKVSIDGVLILDIQAGDPAKRLLAFPAVGGDNGSSMWSRLNIFPITLTAGSHVIKFEYKNTVGIGMFAYELYDISRTQLLDAGLTQAQLEASIVKSKGLNISSKVKRGSYFTETANACPPGYILSVDEACNASCSVVITSPKVEVMTTSTCCKYEDILIDDCLDECPNSCYEYVVGVTPDLSTELALVAKEFTYIDCNGTVIRTTVLGDPKRFKARRNSIILKNDYLVILQEVEVEDTTPGTFARTNCCLNFDPAFPVNAEYRIDDCETKVYYISRNNPPRYFSDLYPYGKDACGNNRTCIKESCDDSKIFPDFCLPELHTTSVDSGGQLAAGMYSFAVAYCDENGDEFVDYTDYNNPVPIFERTVTEQTEYVTAKSIRLEIRHKTRIFEYFSLVVAETVNTTTTYHLVGVYRVNQLSDVDHIIYTGDYKTTFSTVAPVVRSPHYETANIIEKQNDILMIADLEESPRYNFQRFASRLLLNWETVSMPADGQFDYSNPEVAYFFRTYQRDEVYPFGIKFRLKNGKYTDVFHIPGRKTLSSLPQNSGLGDTTLLNASTNKDVFVAETDCTIPDRLPVWKVYNTATPGESAPYDEDLASDIEKQYNCAITNHKKGKFAYWESTEVYPCYDEIWEQSTDPNAPYYNVEALAGKPIRHHKFPDSAISHIHGNSIASGTPFNGAIGIESPSTLYPIGVRLDEASLLSLLNQRNPNGTYYYTVYDPIKKVERPIKDVICGFELVRGNRVGNKSVIAKGLMYDVGEFNDTTNNKKYYYSNYPFNDLRLDPYLMNASRWYDKSREVSISDVDNVDGIGRVGGFTTYRTNGGNKRFTFYSPDTSFQFPKIGTELKLETVEFGRVFGHFVPVLDHPQYRLLDSGAYFDAGRIAAILSTQVGGKNDATISVTGGATATALMDIRYDKLLGNEQLILDLVEKLVPFVNFAAQYNSIANYNQYVPINPLANVNHIGNSRRYIDLGYYANERIVQVFDDAPLHNRLRETSVYLKLRDFIPNLESQLVDNSRYVKSATTLVDQLGGTVNDEGHTLPDATVAHERRTTRAYYSSVKRQFPNQYGQVENIKYVSTGYSVDLFNTEGGGVSLQYKYYPAFGGDTFITPFSFKRKHSFFTRNLVNLPAKIDEIPFDYWLFPNMAYPTYYTGTTSDVNSINAGDVGIALALVLTGVAAGVAGASATGTVAVAAAYLANLAMMDGLNQLWSKFVKKVTVDGSSDHRYYKDGTFYTASYGIPIFFVESDINIHYRHGRDVTRENFYPNVGGGIPDDWLQETTVPIKYDNFYSYNATYSVQNLSPNLPYRLKYPTLECLVNHQNRVIYSDQASKSNLLTDKWLNFRPGNYFDFPKMGGRLIDLNAGETERVYARFENTTKVYNARIVLTSTSPYQLEIGNADMFKQKPVDLAATDLGYIGSQHKAYVKCEFGTFWVDAKRGHVYQITGDGFNEIKNEMNFNWFKENLPFQILKELPQADIDVPSLGIGIVMGWDERFERVFITKLDYRVRANYRTGSASVVKYITDITSTSYRKYVLETGNTEIEITLGDPTFFENKSWTVAYSPKLKNFISFYSFLPNFFISQLGHFQTIKTTAVGSSLWNHNLNPFIYQTYYGKLYPYIIEYVTNSLPIQSTVTSVSILSDILEYYSRYEYYSLGTNNNTNLANFNKAIIYNREQSSGLINLIPELFGNTKQKISYPKMTPNGIETLLSRREGKSTFNGFWNIAAQGNGQSLWTTQWADLINSYPIDKMPNMKAIRNVGVSFQKNKIKSDFTRVRLIQDKYNRYKFVNNLQINQINQTAL